MAIHVLDKHTAELIAAGEVVERPASVVKELVENAVDAGAASVTVEIQRGGISLIQVMDDGGGIDAEDIPLAFVRHATSKVRTATDLDSIGTLGFRGEALASIASVAKVELLTKTPQDEFASLYTIEGGQEIGITAAARGIGTTISVHNLFYNTPARMKFLKKDASEAGYITETVTRLALSHPEVAFQYIKDGKRVFDTPGDGKLQSAVYSVLGAEFARGLLPVEGGKNQYEVTGLVSPPRLARASRAMQFFFINGRFVKNRTIMAALEQAYRGMTMQGKFPAGVLFLQMPPELVDVNVHPAKTEVRFARESDVFDAVYSAVKSALLQNTHNHNTLQLTGQDKPTAAPAPPQNTKATAAPPAAVNTPYTNAPTPARQDAARIRTYNEMVDTLASDSSFAPYKVREDIPRPYAERSLDVSAPQEETQQAAPPAPAPVFAAHDDTADAPQQTSLTPADKTDETVSLRLIGEVFKTFILAQAGETLCIIDKHAAHERLIYERIAASRQQAGSQQLLAPFTVTLAAAAKNALLQNHDALLAAGLEVEDFGGNGVLVRGVPADVHPDDITSLTEEIADRMALNSKDTATEKTEWVLHSMACRAAIKGGDSTHPAQMLRLAQEILEGTVPPFCPHGRPVVLEITHKELEKQFGRLG